MNMNDEVSTQNGKIDRKDFFTFIHKEQQNIFRSTSFTKIIDRKLQALSNLLDPRGLDYLYLKKREEEKLSKENKIK